MRLGILLLVALLSCPWAAFAKQLPLNPDFLEWQQQQKLKTARMAVYVNQGEPLLNAIPSPINREHLKDSLIGPKIKVGMALDIPTETRYDLRDYGYVTPVRDQNPYGTCWAFATIASMESCALKAGWTAQDFSEKHLAYYAYNNVNSTYVSFDLINLSKGVYDQGGNSDQAQALFSRWTGAVSETTEPYANMDMPPAAYAPNTAILGGTRFAPGGANVIENIKYLIKNYGAASTIMFYDSSMFNSTTYGYYNNTPTNTNHLVTIVGWDDNYSKSNFNTAPSRDGAWIVRNSWGSSWGNNGYFYISYDDVIVSTYGAQCFLPKKIVQDDYLYFYDQLAATTTYFSPVSTYWTANIFKAKKNHSLKQVGLAVASIENEYTIYIYKDVAANNPSSGTLVYQSPLITPNTTGYYLVDLPSKIALEKDTDFSIAVKATSNAGKVYYAAEKPFSGWSSKATASAGQSFISSDGSYWNDFTNTAANTNLCIRAIAGNDNINLVPVNSLLLLN